MNKLKNLEELAEFILNLWNNSNVDISESDLNPIWETMVSEPRIGLGQKFINRLNTYILDSVPATNHPESLKLIFKNLLTLKSRLEPKKMWNMPIPL